MSSCHVGPQGQQSSPHPQFVPNSGELKFHKSKEVYAGGPPQIPVGQPVSQIHHQNHLTHQQIHDNVKQQIHHQFHQSASSEIGVHPNHKPVGGRVPPGPTQPKIMVPPGSPHQFPPRGDQGPPKPPGYVGQDAQLANSVFQELFDRQQQKLKHHGGLRPQSLPGSIGGHKVVSGNDLTAQGGQFAPPVVQQYGAPGVPPSGAGGAPGAWPQGPDSDMPKIVSLEVKCEKSVMRVYIAFDKPFFGVIFSKVWHHLETIVRNYY